MSLTAHFSLYLSIKTHLPYTSFFLSVQRAILLVELNRILFVNFLFFFSEILKSWRSRACTRTIVYRCGDHLLLFYYSLLYVRA